MRWDESPRFLVIASVASAVLSAAFGLAAIWDHAGYNIAGAVLALLSALFGYRALERSTHRRLGGIQREHLILRLRQLPTPSELRVVAVPDEEAVRFAQELRDVFLEAGWPARGVFHALPANVGSTGLFIAVQDGNFPSEEERRLLLALSEFGMYAVKSTSPKLTHPKALELLVGHRPTL
ncbi:MAG TPA: hypothetical protein VET45_08020 [Candidatus Binatia bacterium]|nr:hypothetical protein [Candidatus Binatia bacterium]